MSELKNKVKKLFLLKSGPEIRKRPDKEFDLVEMPLEGIVVYWLSLAKLYPRKNVLEQEIALTTEPYVNFLLKLLRSNLSFQQCLDLAQVKIDNFLIDLEKKLILMAISVLGMAHKENPQQVIIRFISKYPLSIIYESKVLATAKKVAEHLLAKRVPEKKFLEIDHRLPPERLMINLLVYNFLARRVSYQQLQSYAKCVRSFYFAEGLSLIVDGFEVDFIKHRLNLQQKEIIAHTKNKMELSARLCAGLKQGLSYEDLSLISQAYL